MPLLLAEFVIGRSTQKEAVTAYKVLVPNSKVYPWIGRMGVVTCFSVLSFYSVVGGWILLYLYYSVTGSFGMVLLIMGNCLVKRFQIR